MFFVFFQYYETDDYIFIEMEYLKGKSLKRIFEYRLSSARQIFTKKTNFQGVNSGPEYEASSDEEDEEIERRYELLELGRRLDLSEPIFSEKEVAEIMKFLLNGL